MAEKPDKGSFDLGVKSGQNRVLKKAKKILSEKDFVLLEALAKL